MTVSITDVLTNKQWNLPDSVAGNPIYIGQYPPGRYDIKNGAALVGTITVVVGPGKVALIPRGQTWNIATQENDRSNQNYCLDYAIWMHSGRFN